MTGSGQRNSGTLFRPALIPVLAALESPDVLTREAFRPHMRPRADSRFFTGVQIMSLLLESSIYAFGFYTALNALIMLVLSILVVRARQTTQTTIGDGGKPEMAAPIRAHANNTEYVPVGLLLMWALASPLGGTIWMLHGVGLPLTLGRLLHAAGLSRSTGPSALRLAGMVLTWLAYIVGIASIFFLVFFRQAATAA